MRGAVDTPQPERRRSPEWSLSPLEQLIDEETRIAVEAQDKGKGYEHAKGSYLMIEDHELEAIEIESNHTIEIYSFVPRAEIDERASHRSQTIHVITNRRAGQEHHLSIRPQFIVELLELLGEYTLAAGAHGRASR